MGDLGHHPDPKALKRGRSITEAKHAMQERIVELTGMHQSSVVMDFDRGPDDSHGTGVGGTHHRSEQ
jgi:hypothetical protein